MDSLILRCSSLDSLMGATRGKQPYGLSKTAQSVIEKIVDEKVYGTKLLLQNKYLTKGIEMEDESIAIFNEVFFKSLTKNEVRLTNDYITGECDLLDKDNDLIIDIKTSWDLNTFSKQRRESTCYEWQLRGYMWLYDVSKACTAHVLPDGYPESLERFADHLDYSHIPKHDRVIIGNIVERDLDKEQQLIEKVEACRLYAKDVYENFFKQGRCLP